MREIALHILDLLENSIRAEATVISVSVTADADRDVLAIVIEDNGTGLKVSPEDALNPFYTTKTGKRTGLGLSLFRAAAQATGGDLKLEHATPHGVRVSVQMGLSHVDRNPLGDLAATFSSVICTNPEIDFRFLIAVGGRTCRVNTFELGARLGVGRQGGLKVARAVREMITNEFYMTDVPI